MANFTIDINLHTDQAAGLNEIVERLKTMANQLDSLTAQVQKNNDTIESAITLIGGIKAALDAAGTDPAKLQALSDSLASEDEKLANAIVANTPAESDKPQAKRGAPGKPKGK